MRAAQFNKVFEEVVSKSRAVLVKKASEYATQDRLHIFKKAANLQNKTNRQVLAGFMAKHTISVYDMLDKDECPSVEVWDEKIIDHINYLILLRALVVEELEGEK